TRRTTRRGPTGALRKGHDPLRRRGAARIPQGAVPVVRRRAAGVRRDPEGAARVVTATPISLYEELKQTYLRYFDTAFWLRDPHLMAERRRLLEEPGRLFTDPLLEPVLPYDADIPLVETCRAAG